MDWIDRVFEFESGIECSGWDSAYRHDYAEWLDHCGLGDVAEAQRALAEGDARLPPVRNEQFAAWAGFPSWRECKARSVRVRLARSRGYHSVAPLAGGRIVAWRSEPVDAGEVQFFAGLREAADALGFDLMKFLRNHGRRAPGGTVKLPDGGRLDVYVYNGQFWVTFPDGDLYGPEAVAVVPADGMADSGARA